MAIPIPDLTIDTIIRFQTFYIPKSEEECWVWCGYVNESGYGQITIKNVHYYASRVAYKLYYEIDPKQSHVLHKCDQPSCVNPFHLFLGDAKDNQLDCRNKGRHPTHKITVTQAQEIEMRFFYKESVKKLAEEFGLSIRQIYSIARGDYWK